MANISPSTRRRLDIQGFSGFDEPTFADIAPWLRFAMALCTLLGATGTVLASPLFLWSLAPIALWGAASPVHPFDHLYNLTLRHLTNTAPLPKRGAPNRFACALGAIMLILTGWAFSNGATVTGYVLGGLLTLVGFLVSTTDICIPSLIFRMMFGFPPGSGNKDG